MGDPALFDIDVIAKKTVSATFSAYQQVAMATTPFTLALNGVKEIAFGAIMAIAPAAVGELVLDGNGRVTIPSAANGIWLPSVLVDCTVGGLVNVQLDVMDATGVAIGTYQSTGYPARRQASLIAGVSVGFAPFRVVPHIALAGLVTIRCTVTALAAVTVSQVEMGLLKLPA